MTNYLISSTGLQVPIYSLPGREPFMLAADLAAAYGTQTDRIAEQVRRNPARFPEDFAFRLTEAELESLKPQNAVSNRANRARPLAFTHAGAIALSGVLKTPVAADVSVIVHRTFAAMEKRAFEEMRFRVQKIQRDHLLFKPIYLRIRMGVQDGWTFEQIRQSCNYTRAKLELAARELLDAGVIDRLPDGMQPDLFGEG